MKNRKRLVILLVAGSIVLGFAIILVSLLANQKRWDRETAFAAAKYDGETILASISGQPCPALDLPAMESGPLAPDLTNADEAWVVWCQVFSGENGLPPAVAWHRERLPASEWKLAEETPDKATFKKGEWTISLEIVPPSDPPRFRREVKWTRDPDTL